LSYGQGASAELVAAAAIFAEDRWRLPVSTTHILSLGVAGTMAANGNGGVHFSTVRKMAAGWLFTLPAAALLSGIFTGRSAISRNPNQIF
jgi:PiT family inorganic phosphate transporter